MNCAKTFLPPPPPRCDADGDFSRMICGGWCGGWGYGIDGLDQEKQDVNAIVMPMVMPIALVRRGT
jgi:hypothetical protein